MLLETIMKKILLFISIIPIFFISCQETELAEEGYIIKRNELATSVGFDWFRSRYDEYTPNNVTIENIKNNIQPNHKFIVFVKPTCSCQGTQLDFPNLIKTFDESNIPVGSYEIWATAKETYSHNYMDIITLNKLPACYLLVDGVPVYSVLDSFYIRTDSGQDLGIEDIVAQSLEN